MYRCVGGIEKVDLNGGSISDSVGINWEIIRRIRRHVVGGSNASGVGGGVDLAT
jgi:hypothetical protein